ncbi:MAG: DnaB-like helicase N-terminal domain-containing protein [Dehalococcoidia bacterium]|jgi:replicative DNA helicase
MSEQRTETQICTQPTYIVAPQSVEAEEALLGSLLVDYSQLGAVVLERLQPDDFYITRHSWIYQTTLDLHHESQEIDPITIAERLSRDGKLDECGGLLYLQELAEHAITLINPRTYAVIIRQRAEERRLLGYLSVTASEIFSNAGFSPLEKWNNAVEQLISLRPYGKNDDILLGRDSIAYYDALVEEERANPVWYPLAWETYEEAAPVYKPGDIVIIAGPEGSGKSAKLFNLVQFYADDMKARVLAIFTEMDKANILARRKATNSLLPYRKLLTPDSLTHNEMAEFHRVDIELDKWVSRVNYWECGATSARELLAEIKNQVEKYGIQIVCIDGLNDLTFNVPKGQTKADAIQSFMAHLETFARENKLFIIGTVQLNREGEALMSGAYKRKAALYLRLHVPKTDAGDSLVYEGIEYRAMPGSDSLYRYVEIEKNRRGPSGMKIKLIYLGARFKWIDPLPTLTDVVNGTVPLNLGGGF